MNRWFADRVVLPLLDAANDDPPEWARREFYDIKRRLLTRWATPDGMDVQHIIQECWTCGGKGHCSRCVNGVYRERFNILARWRWGVHSFHTFERSVLNPPTLPTIRGRVQHQRRGHRASEAWYWLALLYDRKAFWRTFGHTCYLHGSRTPLVVLGSLLFRIRIAWRELSRWRARRFDDDLPF